MANLRVMMDPSKMGNEAESLRNNLQQRVVGQEEAVRQIVNMYQTHLAGMAAPGRPTPCAGSRMVGVGEYCSLKPPELARGKGGFDERSPG